MALASYIRSITEMNNLTARMPNLDEVARYSRSDIYWASKKTLPIGNRKVVKGDVYQFEYGKNFIPEMSYEHRGLVIGVSGKLLYVLPICSFNEALQDHINAYHPVDNINPSSNFYLLKDREFPFLKHDSVLKLNDLKTLSVNRIMYPQGNISIKSSSYMEIERMAFGKCFPAFSYDFSKMQTEITQLKQKLTEKEIDIVTLNKAIKVLQEDAAITKE